MGDMGQTWHLRLKPLTSPFDLDLKLVSGKEKQQTFRII